MLQNTINENSLILKQWCSLFHADRHRTGPHPWLHQRAVLLLPFQVGTLPPRGAAPGSVHPGWRRPRLSLMCLVWLGCDRVPRGAGCPPMWPPGGVGVRRRVVRVVHQSCARARHFRRKRETFVIGSRWLGPMDLCLFVCFSACKIIDNFTSLVLCRKRKCKIFHQATVKRKEIHVNFPK